MVWPNSTLSWLVRSWSPFGPLLPMNNSISGDVWQYEAFNIKNNPNVMFTIRTWLVVLLGAAISVVVNSACAGFLSGVGLIFLSSILFPPFYNKLQVHSSIMIGRDKNGKLKWRDQGVSGSVFLFLPSIFFCPRFTLPFNLVAWTLWSLLLEISSGREEVVKKHFNLWHVMGDYVTNKWVLPILLM